MSKIPHSIKVPTQYKRASLIFKKSIEERKSLKTLIYEEKHAKIRKLFPLFTTYTENKEAIENAIVKSKILEENERFDPCLCRVLITELFFLAKKLNGDSRPVQTVLAYETKLRKYLDSVEDNKKKLKKGKLEKPRYVRVNTNLFSVKEAIEFIESLDFKRRNYDVTNYDDYLSAIKSLGEYEYVIDIIIPELFVFSPLNKYYWATHSFVENKKFILQDRATCLPAKLLDPPINAEILDMCAAPGIKTIQLTNMIGNNGIIYAVERNAERFKMLTKMIKLAYAKCVRPIMKDAIQLNGEEYSKVEYIIVDPSCSGSGMQNRLSLESEKEKDTQRLWKLAGLQIKILQKALTDFPNVKRVVYSTCSLYPEENEQVVQKCLERCPNFKLLSCKKALGRKWKNFGNTKYAGIGKNCLYALPDVDMTDGIFVALFERIKDF